MVYCYGVRDGMLRVRITTCSEKKHHNESSLINIWNKFFLMKTEYAIQPAHFRTVYYHGSALKLNDLFDEIIDEILVEN